MYWNLTSMANNNFFKCCSSYLNSVKYSGLAKVIQIIAKLWALKCLLTVKYLLFYYEHLVTDKYITDRQN